MVLHADAVAQNRSACVRARRIDRDNADGPVFLAIEARKLIDECALARAWRPGESKDPRMSAVREERFKQFGPARCSVLDRADGTGQGARIAGANLIN